VTTTPKTDQSPEESALTNPASLDEQWERNVAMVPRKPDGWLTALPQQPDLMRALPYVRRLMEMLPPPTDDVIDKLAQSILDAVNKADENAVWDSTGSKECVGKTYIWHGCSIQPSDFQDGKLPYYLVCDVTDLESGERTVLTTGSVNLVVAVVKAQLLGSLPWEGQIMGPRRPTKSGYVPLHMKWLSRIVEQPEDDL
jgi:hypothetical protein